MKYGFSSFFSQPSCFYWVGFACAITMGKKKPSTENCQLSCFKMLQLNSTHVDVASSLGTN